ncbi:MAG: THUMP domain-containing protein [Methanosarcinales archaeon]|jgi:tRNA (guanine10-N2)-dimethyltransferase|nr:THUMP domain-containing protein [Methanosarcinales archaeon]
MLYAFELSGEHPEIPAAEVLSVLSSRGLEYSVYENYLNCLVIDIFSNDPAVTDDDVFSMMRNEMPDVLAMTHTISKVIEIVGIDEEMILSAAERFKAADYLNENETFVVRVKRLGDNSVLKSVDLEGKIGGRIYRQGFRASLKNPDVTFRLTLTDKAVFGVLAAAVDRGAYEHRSPQKKPFFYPGVLMPRAARALSNIAGVKKGAIVIDPFCGTAGILLEAGLLGAEVLGTDAQEKIIIGAATNLNGYSKSTGQLLSKEERENGSEQIYYNLFVGDACCLPFGDETADAVITDPPYGRSAAIKAESLEKLYEESFKEMFRILKFGKKAVVVSEIEVGHFAKNAGFGIINVYKQRVHKSLTRTITVLSK